MADLSALRDLLIWMRSEHVVYARVGDIELRLGPPPPRVVDEASPTTSTQSPEDDERHSLETLLHSSGVDADPFIRALRKTRAA